MELYKRIEDDMKRALREGDAAKLSALRMLISAIKVFEIDKKLKHIEEADIIEIVQRQIKQHKESIAQFEKGNRQDLVDKETKELKILETYMPEQLSEDELLNIIKDAIAQTSANLKSDIGSVMKVAMEKVKGRADGKRVNLLAMKLLK